VDAAALESGARATEPPAPVRAGYTFGGWYRDPEGTELWDFAAGTVTGDIILYAKWIQKPVDANGASALRDAGKIIVPAGEDGEGGAEISFDADNTISITIGGETVEYPCVITDDAIIITKNGEEVSIGYAIADGKLHLSGGLDKIDESLPAGTVEPSTENEVVKPEDEETKPEDEPEPPAEYVVSFNPQGGSSVKGVFVTDGGKVTKPADPGRDGYTFAGWYKDAAGTAAWDFDKDTVTVNIILYAKWTEVPPASSQVVLFLPASFTDTAAGIVEELEITIHKSGEAEETEASVTIIWDFDSIIWREGTQILGMEELIVLKAADFGLGTHHISVEVVRDGIPWSQEFRLVVEY
jgi:uncharacterized repeat protein (TIGR02543 family)